MSNQPDIDNQDLPTQAPAVEKGKINVQAANSSLNANRVFNDHYMDAKNHHAEAVNGLSPSTSILDGKAKGPDIKDAIENLKVQYADNLPKNEQLNRKEQLKDITAKTKTGKFSDKIQSELEKELELAEKDDPKDDEKRDLDDPDNENRNSNSMSGGGGGGSIFSLLKGKGNRDKKKGTPLTDSIIKNNNHARNHIHELSEATALCASTQGALRSHLSKQDYDTDTAIEHIKKGKSSPEAQQLMNDPIAQSLINQNDAAAANALMVMNPERMRETHAVLESGLIDPDLKTNFKDQLNNATNALESNEDLPAMDQKMLEKVAESIKEFVNSVKSMFGIKSDANQSAQRTM